ncbi:hypothetical protein LG275_13090 [Chryseomicrobium palamuruense]
MTREEQIKDAFTKAINDENLEVDIKLEKLLDESMNIALATQFPEWDLQPPTQVVRRKGSRWI